MDLQTLSKIIINKALVIKENEVIEVTLAGERQYFDFLDEFTLTLAKAGAFPTIRLNSPSYLQKYLKEVPEKYLRRTPPQALKRINDFHRHINIICNNPEPVFKSVSARKSRIAKEAKRPIVERIQRRNMTTIYLPTEDLAKFFIISKSRFMEVMFNALEIDYKVLRKECKIITKLIRKPDKYVVITTKNQFKLSFKLSDRQAFSEDGSHNLPAGSVFISPLESSVNGSILLDNVPFDGKNIKNLLLSFKNGHIESSSADKNYKVFQRRLSDSYGDKDIFAGFGIGLNPGIKEPIGCEIIDPLLRGSIFISLGSNLIYGGNNFSDLFWSMSSFRPTVSIDGLMVIVDGEISDKLIS